MKTNERKLQRLIVRAREGDQRAFYALCEAKGNDVLYLCMKIMGNVEDGKDAAQEVFVKLQKQIGSLKDPVAFPKWLNRVVHSVCTDLLRKEGRSRHSDLPDSVELIEEERIELLPSQYYDDKEKRALVLAAIDELPSREKEVVLFYYFEDLSYAEIADILGISQSTVYRSVEKAHKSIRETIDAQAERAILQQGAPAASAAPVISRALIDEKQAMLGSGQTLREVLARADIVGAGTAAALFATHKLALSSVAVFIVAATAIGVYFGFFGLPEPEAPTSSFASGHSSSQPQRSENGPNGIETEPVTDDGFEPSDIDAPESLENEPAEYFTRPISDGAAFAKVDLFVQGSLRPKSHSGQVLNDFALYASGILVEAKTIGGMLLARTATDERGAFSFEDLAATEGQTVCISFSLPFGSRYVPTSDNPDGAISLLVGRAAESHDVDLYFKESYVPDCTIEFSDADCDCGHVNPRSVVLGGSDIAGVEQLWSIESPNGTVLHEGVGAQELEQVLQAMHSGGEEGGFYVVCVFLDATGNEKTEKKPILITRRTPQPGEFH